MKILIYSPAFYPNIGGLETVVSILAHEFLDQNHEVILVSQTPNTQPDHFPFLVIRKPTLQKLLKLIKWCDVYFQANVSLKGLWPLLLIRKPLVVTHQGWYCRANGAIAWQDYLKYYVTRFTYNISASRVVAEHIPVPSIVIPNTYQHELFTEMPEVPRNKELVFLGRLVSDKGVDLLIDALGKLKSLNLTPRLTIIGKGPEESNLRRQVEKLGLINQVDFVGAKVREELVQLLNSHQIMVVPSRWEEPFGIVALEGIACGCVVVGSHGGGLSDAIGPCGVTFPNGSVDSLTNELAKLLRMPEKMVDYKKYASSHLLLHKPDTVAKKYLEVLEKAFRC